MILLLLTHLLLLAVPLAAQDVPEWSVEPSLRIGVALGDEDYEFADVMGAVHLSDGAVVVGEMSSQEIRFFDANGTLVRRQGRDGEGPGEYRQVTVLLTCGGDRVWVYDTRLRRLTVLGPDGTLLGIHPAPSPDGVSGPYHLRCDRSGRFIASSWAQGAHDAIMRGESGPFRGTQVVVLADGAGVVLDTVGTFPSGERYLMLRPDGSPGGTAPRRFGPETHVAIGGGRAFVGDAATPRVLIYEGGGLDTLELPLTRRPIRGDDLDALLAERLAAAEDAAEERRVRQFWSDYDFPDAYPFYSDLRVDATGLFWVRAYPGVGESDVEWLVVHPGGHVVARVPLPQALRVTQIDRNHILGVLTADGVQVIQQYRLDRNGP